LTPKKLGLIINPIAGIGGRVGLKGSDGLEVQQQALTLGAVPQAQKRAAIALDVLKPLAADFKLLTAPDQMGEITAIKCGFTPHLVQTFGLEPKNGARTTSENTFQSAQAMRKAGVDLILFAGGDGTARDIYAALGNNLPVLGIPAGVKIYSAVFGITPRDAGELALAFLKAGRIRLKEAEVIDLDEAAYRNGQISTQLYGYLTIPYRRGRIQNQKVPTPASEIVQAQAIAADIIERMAPEQAYILGPGTTTRAIAERLGLSKTLVGVDIITRDKILAKDVGEKQILEYLALRPMGLIVTPTGGQGFVLGRGNQEISPQVIRKVGRENIQIDCLASKIAALRGRPLRVDTNDLEIDRLLSGYIEVITGYREKIVYKIGH
jgi:predicted polyphosphate/ATP-dependent NAD kinase